MNTTMYKTLARKVPIDGASRLPNPIQFRNIKVGCLAIADRVHVGELVRFGTRTSIHNLGSRRTNTLASTLAVKEAHHVGKERGALSAPWGGRSKLPLPSRVRVVCIHICKFGWCSIASVALHSFAWPSNTKEAKGIARIFFVNHCCD